jgi:hypothetical protein
VAKPTLRKGPASAYEAVNEIIREFGDGTGTGGLISLRKQEDGTLLLDIYSISGPVQVRTATPTDAPPAEELDTKQFDGDEVVDTYRGEQRARDLVEGDVIREFNDSRWLTVVSLDSEGGDSVTARCRFHSED